MKNRWIFTVALVLSILIAQCYGRDTEISAADEVEEEPEEVKVWWLKTKPTKLANLVEDKPYNLTLTLHYNGTAAQLPFPVKEAKGALLVVKISMTNTHSLILSQDEVEFTWQDLIKRTGHIIQVTGQVVSYVDLNFDLEIYLAEQDEPLEPIPLLKGFTVTIVRESVLMDNILTLVMGGAAMLGSINMGCALDLSIIKANILRPVGPIVGFISQFTLMPLFSLGMALLLIADPLQGFGLLVLGCSPGGLGSNFWTLLLGGDVNLSITMTFVSIIAALGMMPLWMFLLSGFFLPPGSAVQVPYIEMSISLVTLTLPLGIGLLIRRCKPKVAQFLVDKVLKPFSFVIIILLFSVGFYTLWDLMVLLDGYMLLAGFCVAASGFIFGGLLAIITRRTRPQVIAIALETAMQNGNIAFVLLKTSLPTPYSDVASMTPIAQMLMTSSILFTMLFLVLSYRGIQRCRGKEVKKLIANPNEEQSEVEKSALMMKNISASAVGNNGQHKRDDSPPPNYYGGQVTPEFDWAQNPSLLVPNSPTSSEDQQSPSILSAI